MYEYAGESEKEKVKVEVKRGKVRGLIVVRGCKTHRVVALRSSNCTRLTFIHGGNSRTLNARQSNSICVIPALNLPLPSSSFSSYTCINIQLPSTFLSHLLHSRFVNPDFFCIMIYYTASRILLSELYVVLSSNS